jgi:hypothetical protein
MSMMEAGGSDEKIGPEEALVVCNHMQKLCIDYADADGVSLLEVQKQLRRMQAHIRRLADKSHVQATLDQF